MSNWNNAIESFGEVLPELPSGKPARASVKLDDVLDDIGPMPKEGLLMGIAYDGLPVLFNLLDPVPGSFLVAGDEGSGKLGFLKCVTEYATRMQKVQVAVVSSRPEEWSWLEKSDSVVGVFPVWETSPGELMTSLAAWAHGNKRRDQSVILIVDDLIETIAQTDFDDLQNFRWLIMRGPSRLVRPIVALDTNSVPDNVTAWVDGFGAKVVGCGGDRFLGVGDFKLSNGDLATREDGEWVRFWTPEL